MPIKELDGLQCKVIEDLCLVLSEPVRFPLFPAVSPQTISNDHEWGNGPLECSWEIYPFLFKELS